MPPTSEPRESKAPFDGLVQGTRRKGRTAVLLALILVVAALFLAFFRLGSLPLFDFDEATYAQVSENTLAHGDWLSLEYFGDNWFEKPPLYFWLAMTSAKTFGFSEFAVRLPSALFIVVAVLVVYLLALELGADPWLAFISGAVLLFTQPFYIFGRQARLDVPVTAAILFSVFSLARGVRREKWLMGIGVGLGIGVMFKSVIGLLAVVPIVIFSILYRRWDWLRNKYFWIGMVFFLLIIGPWHVYELLRFGGDFWHTYFVQHVLLRAANAPAANSRTNLDYLSDLYHLVEPWTLTAVALVAGFIALRKKTLLRPMGLFGLLSAVGILLFFFASETKMYTYILPLFPFLAIFIAAGLFYVFDIISGVNRRLYLTLVCAALLTLAIKNTLTDVFVNLPKYFSYVSEEKAIGTFIHEHPQPDAVFLCCWDQTETIKFYSGRQVVDITTLGQAPTFQHYFIVPTSYADNLIARVSMYRSAEVAFRGRHLSLLIAGVP